MESEEPAVMMELDTKIFQIFSDFMLRVTQFEDLVAVGSRLLVGFHQGLDSLQRSPIYKTSELVERIIGANETERVLKYVEAGCINAHDGMQNISRRKCIVDELEGLVKEVACVMQAANENKLHLKGEVTGDLTGLEGTTYKKEEIISSNLHGPEIPERSVMMGVIYSMLKRDYIMQVSALPNEKEAVYGALDKWTAWEAEFPLIAASKALRMLRKRSRWIRVIQWKKINLLIHYCWFPIPLLHIDMPARSIFFFLITWSYISEELHLLKLWAQWFPGSKKVDCLSGVLFYPVLRIWRQIQPEERVCQLNILGPFDLFINKHREFERNINVAKVLM